MAHKIKPTRMNNSRFAFLSDIRPKYVSDNICANANDATIIPISKTESVTPLAIIGIKTNVIAIPECWKNVVPLTKLLKLFPCNTSFFG